MEKGPRPKSINIISGPNFSTSVTTAKNPDAKPRGIPIANKTNILAKTIRLRVPTSTIMTAP
jgi:hypothetical protein